MTRSVHVALASDLHPTYAFFVPITCRVWQNRIGYEPILTLVGSEDEWSASAVGRVVKVSSIEFRPKHVRVPAGYRSCNVAQIARLYAWLCQPESYVITSDIDMWPVSREFFERRTAPDGVSVLYGNNPTRFPICYLGASAETWGTVLPRAAGLSLPEAVTAHMHEHLKPQSGFEDAWQHDEEFLTARVCEWGAAGGAVALHKRADGEPPSDRLDRASWGGSEVGKVDAHLLRPGYDDAHWPQLRGLLERLCGAEVTAWADGYRRVFLEALKGL